MKKFEALYNGYTLKVASKNITTAEAYAKEVFKKSLRLTRLQDLYFSIKEI